MAKELKEITSNELKYDNAVSLNIYPERARNC